MSDDFRKAHGLDLTAKEKEFCRVYLQTMGNGPEAAMQAYDCSSRNSARVIACRNLQKPRIRRYLKRQLKKHDLISPAIVSFQNALKATLVYRGQRTNVPDHRTRMAAAEKVLTIAALAGPQRQEAAGAESGPACEESQPIRDESQPVRDESWPIRDEIDDEIQKAPAAQPLSLLDWIYQQEERRPPAESVWDRFMKASESPEQ